LSTSRAYSFASRFKHQIGGKAVLPNTSLELTMVAGGSAQDDVDAE
jgi:hypothetical protein